MRYLLSIDPTCARSIRPALDRSDLRSIAPDLLSIDPALLSSDPDLLSIDPADGGTIPARDRTIDRIRRLATRAALRIGPADAARTPGDARAGVAGVGRCARTFRRSLGRPRH